MSADRDALSRVMSGKTWENFCDELKAAGQVILRPETPATELDRAEGWRYLSRLTRIALDMTLECADPDFPAFYAASHPTAKIGADNPDNNYYNATIAGDRDYRVRGRRGTNPYLSFGTKANRYSVDGTMASTGELDGRNLKVEADGSFEILVSQKKPASGNWLPLAPDSSMLLIRETFLDRARETAGHFTIERIGRPRKPAPLSAERVDKGLMAAAAFVHGTAKTFADWAVELRPRPNEIWTVDQTRFMRGGGDPNIFYLFGYWEIGADEALVIDTEVPDCELWNIQIDNYWYESLEYRHLRACLNSHTAKYNKDGSLTMVLAHEDPGVPNYLDTGGHATGTLLLRWTRAKSHPVPNCRIVKVASLKGKSAA